MQILHTGINVLLLHYIQGMDQAGRIGMHICILIPIEISIHCDTIISDYGKQGDVISGLGNSKNNWMKKSNRCDYLNKPLPWHQLENTSNTLITYRHTHSPLWIGKHGRSDSKWAKTHPHTNY